MRSSTGRHSVSAALTGLPIIELTTRDSNAIEIGFSLVSWSASLSCDSLLASSAGWSRASLKRCSGVQQRVSVAAAREADRRMPGGVSPLPFWTLSRPPRESDGPREFRPTSRLTLLQLCQLGGVPVRIAQRGHLSRDIPATAKGAGSEVRRWRKLPNPRSMDASFAQVLRE